MQYDNKSSRTPQRKFWFELIGWGIIALLILEILVRLFMFKTPTRIIDHEWGKVPTENSCYRRGTEGFGMTCYSSNGEIDTPYHSGQSVAVLGDSYTEALQVDNSEKFASLTEVYLRDRGVMADLHNLGDSGLNIADYVYLAPLVKKAFSPRAVIFQINANDFPASLDSDNENYFVQNGKELVLYHQDDVPDSVALENLIRSSSLFTYMVFRWDIISPKITFNSSSNTELQDAENINKFGNPETDGISTDQIALQLDALKKAYSDSSLILLFIPNVPIVSDTDISWSNPYDEYYIETFRSIDGLHVVYPIEAFRELYDEQKAFPRGFFNTTPNTGHINEYGHALVAQALAESLEDILR